MLFAGEHGSSRGIRWVGFWNLLLISEALPHWRDRHVVEAQECGAWQEMKMHRADPIQTLQVVP